METTVVLVAELLLKVNEPPDVKAEVTPIKNGLKSVDIPIGKSPVIVPTAKVEVLKYRVKLPPYIHPAVEASEWLRAPGEAALLPIVNVLPFRLMFPLVIVSVEETPSSLPLKVICGAVPKVLLTVRLPKVVAPVMVWAVVPLKLTVLVPPEKVPLLVQFPARLISMPVVPLPAVKVPLLEKFPAMPIVIFEPETLLSSELAALTVRFPLMVKLLADVVTEGDEISRLL